jgi:hypothetical protein
MDYRLKILMCVLHRLKSSKKKYRRISNMNCDAVRDVILTLLDVRLLKMRILLYPQK